MCILECNDSDTGGIIDWGVSMGKLTVRFGVPLNDDMLYCIWFS